MTTQTYTSSLHIIDCFSCHVTFGLDRTHYNDLLDDGRNFYCPNGHRQHFIDSKVKALEAQLARSNDAHERTKRCLNRSQDNLSLSRNQTRAQKAAKTRIKNRIAKGICPCCNRSFTDIRRHMETKHPEYGEHECKN